MGIQFERQLKLNFLHRITFNNLLKWLIQKKRQSLLKSKEKISVRFSLQKKESN